MYSDFYTGIHYSGVCKKNLGQYEDNASDKNVEALPLVYTLIPSKTQVHYTKVLEAIFSAAKKYQIENCRPIKLMTDFELAIIRERRAVFVEAVIKCCVFHLGQYPYTI